MSPTESVPIWFIEVTDVHRITPRMARITFGGDELGDLAGAEPDQQVKLYFPKPGQSAPRLPEPDADGDFMRWYGAFNAIPQPERPWTRSYTVRAHDPRQRTLDIDFVLHDHAGPATRWAQTAQPGDTIGMFGPSQTFARPIPISTFINDADWFLMAGDETALPAIGSLIEWLPDGTRAVAYIEISDAAEEQRIDTQGHVAIHWLHRGEVPAGDSSMLVDAVRDARFPPGSAFAWIAGESGAVRALRRHLVDERGLDKRAIEFTGHWRRRLTQDDPPTDEDLAEAQERLADAQDTRT